VATQNAESVTGVGTNTYSFLAASSISLGVLHILCVHPYLFDPLMLSEFYSVLQSFPGRF
jgi:hypothetical protein